MARNRMFFIIVCSVGNEFLPKTVIGLWIYDNGTDGPQRENPAGVVYNKIRPAEAGKHDMRPKTSCPATAGRINIHYEPRVAHPAVADPGLKRVKPLPGFSR